MLLLQLRHNYLGGVIMVLATDIEDSFASMAKLLMAERDVPMQNLTARVDQYLDWVKDIQQTRLDLGRLGYKVQVNTKFGIAMGNIKWKPSTAKGLPEKVRNTEADFIRIYGEIVNDNKKLIDTSAANLVIEDTKRLLKEKFGITDLIAFLGL